jgi:hypothetical protein
LQKSEQFLQFALGDNSYLLPSGASLAIEKRDNLVSDDTGRGDACAWRSVGSERWPVYCLDAELRVARTAGWEEAIFLPASPHAVGLAAHGVQLLPAGEVSVVPFRPIGPAPTRAGHLFNAAWVRETQVILVFDHGTLALFLLGLGA